MCLIQKHCFHIKGLEFCKGGKPYHIPTLRLCLHRQDTMYGKHIYVEKLQKLTQSAGFEPARAEPNGFLVHRLNHSATTTDADHTSGLKNITLMFFSSSSSIQFYGATVPATPVHSDYVSHVRTGQGWTRNRCVTHPPMTYMSSRSVVRQNATSVVKNHRFLSFFGRFFAPPPPRVLFFHALVSCFTACKRRLSA